MNNKTKILLILFFLLNTSKTISDYSNNEIIVPNKQNHLQFIHSKFVSSQYSSVILNFSILKNEKIQEINNKYFIVSLFNTNLLISDDEDYSCRLKIKTSDSTDDISTFNDDRNVEIEAISVQEYNYLNKNINIFNSSDNQNKDFSYVTNLICHVSDNIKIDIKDNYSYFLEVLVKKTIIDNFINNNAITQTIDIKKNYNISNVSLAISSKAQITNYTTINTFKEDTAQLDTNTSLILAQKLKFGKISILETSYPNTKPITLSNISLLNETLKSRYTANNVKLLNDQEYNSLSKDKKSQIEMNSNCSLGEFSSSSNENICNEKELTTLYPLNSISVSFDVESKEFYALKDNVLMVITLPSELLYTSLDSDSLNDIINKESDVNSSSNSESKYSYYDYYNKYINSSYINTLTITSSKYSKLSASETASSLTQKLQSTSQLLLKPIRYTRTTRNNRIKTHNTNSFIITNIAENLTENRKFKLTIKNLITKNKTSLNIGEITLSLIYKNTFSEIASYTSLSNEFSYAIKPYNLNYINHKDTKKYYSGIAHNEFYDIYENSVVPLRLLITLPNLFVDSYFVLKHVGNKNKVINFSLSSCDFSDSSYLILNTGINSVKESIDSTVSSENYIFDNDNVGEFKNYKDYYSDYSLNNSSFFGERMKCYSLYNKLGQYNNNSYYNKLNETENINVSDGLVFKLPRINSYLQTSSQGILNSENEKITLNLLVWVTVLKCSTNELHNSIINNILDSFISENSGVGLEFQYEIYSKISVNNNIATNDYNYFTDNVNNKTEEAYMNYSFNKEFLVAKSQNNIVSYSKCFPTIITHRENSFPEMNTKLYYFNSNVIDSSKDAILYKEFYNWEMTVASSNDKINSFNNRNVIDLLNDFYYYKYYYNSSNTSEPYNNDNWVHADTDIIEFGIINKENPLNIPIPTYITDFNNSNISQVSSDNTTSDQSLISSIDFQLYEGKLSLFLSSNIVKKNTYKKEFHDKDSNNDMYFTQGCYLKWFSNNQSSTSLYNNNSGNFLYYDNTVTINTELSKDNDDYYIDIIKENNNKSTSINTINSNFLLDDNEEVNNNKVDLTYYYKYQQPYKLESNYINNGSSDSPLFLFSPKTTTQLAFSTNCFSYNKDFIDNVKSIQSFYIDFTYKFSRKYDSSDVVTRVGRFLKLYPSLYSLHRVLHDYQTSSQQSNMNFLDYMNISTNDYSRNLQDDNSLISVYPYGDKENLCLLSLSKSTFADFKFKEFQFKNKKIDNKDFLYKNNNENTHYYIGSKTVVVMLNNIKLLSDDIDLTSSNYPIASSGFTDKISPNYYNNKNFNNTNAMKAGKPELIFNHITAKGYNDNGFLTEIPFVMSYTDNVNNFEMNKVDFSFEQYYGFQLLSSYSNYGQGDYTNDAEKFNTEGEYFPENYTLQQTVFTSSIVNNSYNKRFGYRVKGSLMSEMVKGGIYVNNEKEYYGDGDITGGMFNTLEDGLFSFSLNNNPYYYMNTRIELTKEYLIKYYFDTTQNDLNKQIVDLLNEKDSEIYIPAICPYIPVHIQKYYTPSQDNQNNQSTFTNKDYKIVHSFSYFNNPTFSLFSYNEKYLIKNSIKKLCMNTSIIEDDYCSVLYHKNEYYKTTINNDLENYIKLSTSENTNNINTNKLYYLLNRRIDASSFKRHYFKNNFKESTKIFSYDTNTNIGSLFSFSKVLQEKNYLAYNIQALTNNFRVFQNQYLSESYHNQVNDYYNNYLLFLSYNEKFFFSKGFFIKGDRDISKYSRNSAEIETNKYYDDDEYYFHKESLDNRLFIETKYKSLADNNNSGNDNTYVFSFLISTLPNDNNFSNRDNIITSLDNYKHTISKISEYDNWKDLFTINEETTYMSYYKDTILNSDCFVSESLLSDYHKNLITFYTKYYNKLVICKYKVQNITSNLTNSYDGTTKDVIYLSGMIKPAIQELNLIDYFGGVLNDKIAIYCFDFKNPLAKFSSNMLNNHQYYVDYSTKSIKNENSNVESNYSAKIEIREPDSSQFNNYVLSDRKYVISINDSKILRKFDSSLTINNKDSADWKINVEYIDRNDNFYLAYDKLNYNNDAGLNLSFTIILDDAFLSKLKLLSNNDVAVDENIKNIKKISEIKLPLLLFSDTYININYVDYDDYNETNNTYNYVNVNNNFQKQSFKSQLVSTKLEIVSKLIIKDHSQCFINIDELFNTKVLENQYYLSFFTHKELEKLKLENDLSCEEVENNLTLCDLNKIVKYFTMIEKKIKNKITENKNNNNLNINIHKNEENKINYKLFTEEIYNSTEFEIKVNCNNLFYDGYDNIIEQNSRMYSENVYGEKTVFSKLLTPLSNTYLSNGKFVDKDNMIAEITHLDFLSFSESFETLININTGNSNTQFDYDFSQIEFIDIAELKVDLKRDIVMGQKIEIFTDLSYLMLEGMSEIKDYETAKDSTNTRFNCLPFFGGELIYNTYNTPNTGTSAGYYNTTTNKNDNEYLSQKIKELNNNTSLLNNYIESCLISILSQEDANDQINTNDFTIKHKITIKIKDKDLFIIKDELNKTRILYLYLFPVLSNPSIYTIPYSIISTHSHINTSLRSLDIMIHSQYSQYDIPYISSANFKSSNDGVSMITGSDFSFSNNVDINDYNELLTYMLLGVSPVVPVYYNSNRQNYNILIKYFASTNTEINSYYSNLRSKKETSSSNNNSNSNTEVNDNEIIYYSNICDITSISPLLSQYAKSIKLLLDFSKISFDYDNNKQVNEISLYFDKNIIQVYKEQINREEVNINNNDYNTADSTYSIQCETNNEFIPCYWSSISSILSIKLTTPINYEFIRKKSESSLEWSSYYQEEISIHGIDINLYDMLFNLKHKEKTNTEINLFTFPCFFNDLNNSSINEKRNIIKGKGNYIITPSQLDFINKTLLTNSVNSDNALLIEKGNIIFYKPSININNKEKNYNNDKNQFSYQNIFPEITNEKTLKYISDYKASKSNVFGISSSKTTYHELLSLNFSLQKNNLKLNTEYTQYQEHSFYQSFTIKGTADYTPCLVLQLPQELSSPYFSKQVLSRINKKDYFTVSLKKMYVSINEKHQEVILESLVSIKSVTLLNKGKNFVFTIELTNYILEVVNNVQYLQLSLYVENDYFSFYGDEIKTGIVRLSLFDNSENVSILFDSSINLNSMNDGLNKSSLISGYNYIMSYLDNNNKKKFSFSNWDGIDSEVNEGWFDWGIIAFNKGLYFRKTSVLVNSLNVLESETGGRSFRYHKKKIVFDNLFDRNETNGEYSVKINNKNSFSDVINKITLYPGRYNLIKVYISDNEETNSTILQHTSLFLHLNPNNYNTSLFKLRDQIVELNTTSRTSEIIGIGTSCNTPQGKYLLKFDYLVELIDRNYRNKDKTKFSDSNSKSINRNNLLSLINSKFHSLPVLEITNKPSTDNNREILYLSISNNYDFYGSSNLFYSVFRLNINSRNRFFVHSLLQPTENVNIEIRKSNTNHINSNRFYIETLSGGEFVNVNNDLRSFFSVKQQQSYSSFSIVVGGDENNIISDKVVLTSINKCFGFSNNSTTTNNSNNSRKIESFTNINMEIAFWSSNSLYDGDKLMDSFYYRVQHQEDYLDKEEVVKEKLLENFESNDNSNIAYNLNKLHKNSNNTLSNDLNSITITINNIVPSYLYCALIMTSSIPYENLYINTALSEKYGFEILSNYVKNQTIAEPTYEQLLHSFNLTNTPYIQYYYSFFPHSKYYYLNSFDYYNQSESVDVTFYNLIRDASYKLKCVVTSLNATITKVEKEVSLFINDESDTPSKITTQELEENYFYLVFNITNFEKIANSDSETKTEIPKDKEIDSNELYKALLRIITEDYYNEYSITDKAIIKESIVFDNTKISENNDKRKIVTTDCLKNKVYKNRNNHNHTNNCFLLNRNHNTTEFFGGVLITDSVKNSLPGFKINNISNYHYSNTTSWENTNIIEYLDNYYNRNVNYTNNLDLFITNLKINSSFLDFNNIVDLSVFDNRTISEDFGMFFELKIKLLSVIDSFSNEYGNTTYVNLDFVLRDLLDKDSFNNEEYEYTIFNENIYLEYLGGNGDLGYSGVDSPNTATNAVDRRLSYYSNQFKRIRRIYSSSNKKRYLSTTNTNTNITSLNYTLYTLKIQEDYLSSSNSIIEVFMKKILKKYSNLNFLNSELSKYNYKINSNYSLSYYKEAKKSVDINKNLYATISYTKPYLVVNSKYLDSSSLLCNWKLKEIENFDNYRYSNLTASSIVDIIKKENNECIDYYNINNINNYTSVSNSTVYSRNCGLFRISNKESYNYIPIKILSVGQYTIDAYCENEEFPSSENSIGFILGNIVATNLDILETSNDTSIIISSNSNGVVLFWIIIMFIIIVFFE